MNSQQADNPPLELQISRCMPKICEVFAWWICFIWCIKHDQLYPNAKGFIAKIFATENVQSVLIWVAIIFFCVCGKFKGLITRKIIQSCWANSYGANSYVF